MRALDLFCGQGLVSWGLWQSGRFTEIVGVDIVNMSSRYAFDFVQANALSLTYDFLMDFDFIWASPPCQGYSKMTPDRSKHLRLVAATHLMLVAAGKPYVIENVEGSGQELKPNLRLYGHDVGLPMKRVRYFHINACPGTKVNTRASVNLSIDRKINLSSGVQINPHGGDYVTKAELIKAFGLGGIPEKRLRRLSCDGIKEGIPPAFSKRIVEMIYPHKTMIG